LTSGRRCWKAGTLWRWASFSKFKEAVESKIDDWDDLTRKYYGHRFEAFVNPWNSWYVKRRSGPAEDRAGEEDLVVGGPTKR
jgi:hypothetical protein